MHYYKCVKFISFIPFLTFLVIKYAQFKKILLYPTPS